MKSEIVEEVGNYMKTIKKFQPIPKEEELKLAKQFKNKRISKKLRNKARDKLISANLKFVVKEAYRYTSFVRTARGKFSILDLIQAGNLGLIDALDRYDPDRGWKFLTYARWWIKARIVTTIISNISSVKYGTTHNQRIMFFKMGIIRDIVNLRDPDQKEEARAALCKETGLERHELERLEKRVNFHVSSLDSPINSNKSSRTDEGDNLTIIDTIQSDEDLEEDIIQENLHSVQSVRLCKAMKSLSEREANILRRRYMDEDRSTLETIGKGLGISRERVRQIEKRSLEKMKEFLEQKD